ncbi:unnamed protein product, partial [Discosporangium mesarthrocarpum]
METRSSPSLHRLKELARHARVSEDKLPNLSKPALFSHLRSKFDYTRLERARQLALKRANSNGGSTISSASTGSDGSSSGYLNCESSFGRHASKRHCHRPCSGSTSASTRSQREEAEELPAASIFLQTRSRSRCRGAAPTRESRPTSGSKARAGGAAGAGAAPDTMPSHAACSSTRASEPPTYCSTPSAAAPSPRHQHPEQPIRVTRSSRRSRQASPVSSTGTSPIRFSKCPTAA